jgi:hypothetical protein
MHPEQLDALVLPSGLLYPSGQLSHDEDPGCDWYVPIGQRVHLAAVVLSLYDPAAHGSHVP